MSVAAVASQVGYTSMAAPVAYTQAAPATYTQAAPATYAQAAPATYSQAAPATYMQAAPASVMQAVPMPTPTYMYPAGSSEVPVYGSAVTAPQIYQQPAAAVPTVSYQQAQPMTQEQLKTIFPMGAPSTSTFQPFTQTQYQYNYVDSASAFVPASLAGLPVAAPQATVPAVAPAEPAAAAVVDPAPAASVLAPEVPATAVPAVPEPVPAATTTTTTKKKASSKKTSSKKLSSKKKEKGCC